MRNFNLDNINAFYIHRVYTENNDLVLWHVDGHRTRYENLTLEEREDLINQLQKKFKEERVMLEVYNGLDEAKSNR